jgi:hypothetical protein
MAEVLYSCEYGLLARYRDAVRIASDDVAAANELAWCLAAPPVKTVRTAQKPSTLPSVWSSDQVESTGSKPSQPLTPKPVTFHGSSSFNRKLAIDFFPGSRPKHSKSRSLISMPAFKHTPITWPAPQRKKGLVKSGIGSEWCSVIEETGEITFADIPMGS